MYKCTVLLIALLTLSSCKTLNSYEDGELSRTTSTDAKISFEYAAPSGGKGFQAAVEAEVGSTCSPKGIFACMASDGGKACLDRCEVNNLYFCNVPMLNKCISANGGSNACHKKYCDASGDGEVMATSMIRESGKNPNELIKFPSESEGIGYSFYMSEHMRYGTRRNVLRIQEAAKRLFRDTGFPLLIGDYSNKFGGHGDRHSTHQNGHYVDLAVIGNTPDVLMLTYLSGPTKFPYLNEPHLSKISYTERARNASKYFFKELIEISGAGQIRIILYNDPLSQSVAPMMINYRNHSDHSHIEWIR